MKFYEITIQPLSAFGTQLKGDTIFGHFCWQAVYDDTLLEGGLENNLSQYDKKPFAVFSSAFPKVITGGKTFCFLPKPAHPSFLDSGEKVSTREKLETRKALKKKKWMPVSSENWLIEKGNQCLSDEEIIEDLARSFPHEKLMMLDKMRDRELYIKFTQSHNAINRLTQTTAGDSFAPYSKENYFFFPGITLCLFTLIDESVTSIDRIKKGLKKIGQAGFGRDASTGMGKFEFIESKEIPLDGRTGDACYALSPLVPEKESFETIFFTPFIRYGKHGDRLAASVNPFKRPVIMAEEGAVLIPKDREAFNKPYIGTAVKNVSFLKPETVCQGYAPWLPVKLEAGK